MSTSFPSARMSSLIPSSTGRPGEDPIFAIHAEAVRREQAGEDVIDASIGALMLDDGRLAVMPTVFEAFQAVDPHRAAGYAPIAGSPEFLAAVERDVFGVHATGVVSVATPGGTGALHHAVANFLEPGEAVYTSSFYWGPYRTIAEHTGRAIETFTMFDGAGRFNTLAFERGLRALAARQGRLLVLLNFPCHNPTGYSLDDAEWGAVARIVRDVARETPLAFLIDLAYARYGAAGSESWLRHVSPIAEVAPVLVAWTASKSFAQYGARVGALLALVEDDEERAHVRNALTFSCRGTWSNCNHLGQLAVARLLSDPISSARADADRAQLTQLLATRVEEFNRAATDAELSYPRYEGGFFVSVFTDDPYATAQVCAELGVFVVPLRQGAVRVALCATPAAAIPRLVAALRRGVAR
jgi:aromatic-amino-acid transaminase